MGDEVPVSADEVAGLRSAKKLLADLWDAHAVMLQPTNAISACIESVKSRLSAAEVLVAVSRPGDEARDDLRRDLSHLTNAVVSADERSPLPGFPRCGAQWYAAADAQGVKGQEADPCRKPATRSYGGVCLKLCEAHYQSRLRIDERAEAWRQARACTTFRAGMPLRKCADCGRERQEHGA